MINNTDRINQLNEKLETLLRKQHAFYEEINQLKLELKKLKTIEEEAIELQAIIEEKTKPSESIHIVNSPISNTEAEEDFSTIEEDVITETNFQKHSSSDAFSIEKFIGENLINKVGIAITILGVAIGAKYSIDNGLISPLTRIVLGYLFGLGLLGVGIKLKENYEKYSAVLVSGSMTIMYFITYLACDSYYLIPRIPAFIIMLLFTVFTVITALKYNLEVIAHIGLVGAYAVPFLLSTRSNNVTILFVYITIINLGILTTAFKRYWKRLYYVSLILTWLIFASWYIFKYTDTEHFGIAITFSIIYFIIFYGTLLIFKSTQHHNIFRDDDMLLFILNSFIFYGLGYSIVSSNEVSSVYLGTFTLCNAMMHFAVCVYLYRKNLADKNLFYLIAGFVLIFLTLTIPVQLDGNWVTILWAGEALLLFWISRTKQLVFYERRSYAVMVLSFISLLQDWQTAYKTIDSAIPHSKITFLFNTHFLTSILFISAFACINSINKKTKQQTKLRNEVVYYGIIEYLLPAILIVSTFFALRLEIGQYWDQRIANSTISFKWVKESNESTYINEDLKSFKTIWLINYSLLFVSLMAVINIKKIKNYLLANVIFIAAILTLVAFLLQSLYCFIDLQETYLHPPLAKFFKRGPYNIWIRYVSLSFVASMLYLCYKQLTTFAFTEIYKPLFNVLLNITILWILSSEFINLMIFNKSEESYKLGLSILWGIYSLALIIIGIAKSNKTMRIQAIVLFGITLIKLFFYDISNLNTIAKTIVFVTLGILLLIISFLYNKYKHLIIDDETDN